MALGLLVGTVAWAADPSPTPAALPERPNIVAIQTDDQTIAQLYAGGSTFNGTTIRAMPQTLARIAGRGITFTRYYVSTPLCCPSRASFLTGRYSHNSRVLGNLPPEGGYPRLNNAHTVAVWLQRAGYRTIHVGKFLNYYGQPPYDQPGAPAPAGWSDWRTLSGENSTHLFYGYRLNVNGTLSDSFGSFSAASRDYPQRDAASCPATPALFGQCNYQTDVLTAQALDAIADTPSGTPFFLSLDYLAPHGDYARPIGPEPAPRHYGSFAGDRVPRSPGWNEGDVSDKPSFVRENPPLTPQEVHSAQVEWEKSLESLRSVDEGVRQLIDTLRALGRLRNTYIFFFPDNGFFFGEHRFSRAKFLAYEPAVHVPLLVRGPGIKPGSRSGELVANVDLAPTMLELAGASADRRVDGRSFLRFALDPTLRSRRPILFEAYAAATDVATAKRDLRRRRIAFAQATPRNYVGVLLGHYKWLSHDTGEKELYDLLRDPFEQRSLHRDRRYYPVRNFLAAELDRLEGCLGQTCKEAAAGPIPESR